MKTLLILAAMAGAAHAQVVFPADAEYVPLHCGGHVMTDARADDPNFLGVLDIVGDNAHPAALTTADAQLLYLRIRLDDDPSPAGVPAPAAWGVAFDLDGNLKNYELLVLVDNVAPDAANVRIMTNATVTTPNDPAEPADLPPVKTYPFAMNARTVAAGGDFFLDFAVAWADLVPRGLDHTTQVRMWVASSDSGNALTGDFACADGPPTALDVIVSDVTVADPTVDTDGDGFTNAQEVAAGTNPNDPNSVPAGLELEGGGGCSAGGGAGALVGALVLALRKRRRRRSV
jgi:thrombospondin type 3 repeat protein